MSLECRPFSHDNSMGLVRYYLAFAVLVAHFNIVFGTEYLFPTSSYNAVGGFFALSGFLVYKSYLKSTDLKHYIMRRARRILPPYLFIVFVCAFGLFFLSDLSAADYFFSKEWLKYLAANVSFLNFLAPTLPGVFRELPIQAVNGSLWTMKIEILLYLSVPVVAWIIRRVNRWNVNQLYVFGLIYILSMSYRLLFSELYVSSGKEIYNILSRQVFGQLMYFYVGVCIYFRYEEFMKYRNYILPVIAVFILAGDYIPYYQIIISPVVVSFLTLYCASVRTFKIFNTNNISYDIYLMHMPVILVCCVIGNEVGMPVEVSFCVSVVVTCLLGAVSWFGIGKRFLYPRK